MDVKIVTAVIAFIGVVLMAILTFVGTIISAKISAKVAIQTTNNLIIYRIDKLEEKVDKHNNLVDRMYKVEGRLGIVEVKESMKEEN